MIKGKTPEEIRKTFNIQNDFRYDSKFLIFMIFKTNFSIIINFFTVHKKKSKLERRMNGVKKNRFLRF